MDNSFVIRKFQRSIAGLSLLAILASFAGFGTAFASSFPDVSSDYFAYDQIDALSDAGVMTGNDDGTFAPDRTLNRAEAAKLLLNAFGIEVDSTYDAGFSDVADGMWYTDYVNTAAEWSIVSGYSDGTYRPGEYINRAEFAKMVVNASGLDNDGTMGSDIFNDVSSGVWFDEYVGTMYVNSVTDGTSSNTYSPADWVSRGAAAKMTYNSMYPVYRGDTTGGTDNNSDAVVTVEVSNDTPTADTIPSNATSVALASFDFTAEGDDASLEALTVHQYGISSVPSTATVYLYEGSTRLTNGTSVNSTSHEADFRSLNVDLNDGDTVTLTVRMDMGTWSPSGEVGFEIESADMVDVGTATVEGDFAVQGEKFSVSTTSVGTITVEKNGTVDNGQVGEDGVTIGKFKLTADSTEGGNVQELGVYISGTVSTADIENFQLFISGDDAEPIAQVDTVDDLDVARFVVGEGEGVMDGMSDGYTLEKGATKSFYVTADLNTGRTDDTLKVYFDLDTDVVVVGDLYGYGMSVNRKGFDGGSDSTLESNGTCAASSDDCALMTLEGGDITVSSNGPAASDIAINGKDVTLLNFTVTSISDVTFDSFPIALTASESADTTEGLLSSSTANFTDIKVVDTDSGDQIYSSIDATSMTAALGGSTAISESADTDADGITDDEDEAYYVYTDDWDVTAGSEYNLSIKADVANTSTLDLMTIYATLPFTSSYPVLKDVNNKVLTNTTVLVPASSIVGKTMTVRSPALTLAQASTPSGNNTYVKGSQDVKFLGVSLACGESTDCRITDMVFQGYLDDDGDNAGGGAAPTLTTSAGQPNSTAITSYVGSVWLEDGEGNVVGASKGVNTSTFKATFDDMDWTINGGDTEILYVVGDLSSSSYANSDAESIAFSLSSSNVTVENEDGNSFSATNNVNTTPSVYVTSSNGGSLTVAVNTSDTPRQDIVVAGSTDVEMSKFNFTSTREAFVVSDLAVTNRQSNVTSTTTLGDYDNNVIRVCLGYTDSEGNEVSGNDKCGYMTNGVAEFSGLDFFIDADETEAISVYADLNSIASSGTSSTAGEYVELNLAFENFKAVAQGSGETYRADKLDATTASDSDLDFGSISWTDSGYDTNNGLEAVTAGTSQTITIDTGTTVFPIGTLLFVDAAANGTYDEATDSLFVTTAVWSTTAPTVKALNDGDAALANDLNVYYSLAGVGYMTETNRQVVYESLPTLALDSSSPSGNQSVQDNQTVFSFTVAAADEEKVQVRAGLELAVADGYDAAGANNQAPATDALTGNQVDGSATGQLLTGFQAGDSISFDGTTDVASYGRLAFWMKWTDAAVVASPTFTDYKVNVISSATADSGGAGTALSQTACGADQASLVTGEWYFCDLSISALNADASDRYVHIEFDDMTELLAADTMTFDQVKVYNDKIVMNISSTDLDTYANNADNAAAPVDVQLTKGSQTSATGYISTLTNGASETTTGTVTFIPTTTIEVGAGSTNTYNVVVDTTDLVGEDASQDDTLAFSIALGSATDTNALGSSFTVTAGGFWWYETNAQVQWLGDVSSTTFSSNTVKY